MEQFKEIISEKWTNRASTFDEDHATENLDEWRKMLESQIGLNGNGKTLDIGTGTGFLANMLAELGYTSVGIDFSEGMLAIGKENTAKRGVTVEYHLGDGDELPFEDNSFDAVVNCRVMWTLLDPVKSFAEWRRVLKPGGKLLSFTRVKSDHPHPHPHPHPHEGQDGEQQEQQHNHAQYPEEIEKALPLRHASMDKHLIMYEEAGFNEPEAILLPKKLGLDPEMHSQWYVVKGIK